MKRDLLAGVAVALLLLVVGAGLWCHYNPVPPVTTAAVAQDAAQDRWDDVLAIAWTLLSVIVFGFVATAVLVRPRPQPDIVRFSGEKSPEIPEEPQ